MCIVSRSLSLLLLHVVCFTLFQIDFLKAGRRFNVPRQHANNNINNSNNNSNTNNSNINKSNSNNNSNTNNALPLSTREGDS